MPSHTFDELLQREIEKRRGAPSFDQRLAEELGRRQKPSLGQQWLDVGKAAGTFVGETARGMARFGAGELVPPEGGREPAQVTRDALRGFNSQLARVLGEGGAAFINASMPPIGEKLLKGLIEPEDAVAQVRGAMTRVGLDLEGVDNLATQFGENTFNAMLIMSALGTAAPSMVALPTDEALLATRPIAGLAHKVLTDFGKFIQSDPAMFATTEIGATAGATIGEDVGGTTGALLGAATGAVTAQGAFGAARGAGRAMFPPISQRPGVPGPSPTSLRTAGPGAEEVVERVRVDIEGELGLMDAAVARAHRGISNLDPDKQAVTLMHNMDRARKVGRALETRYWNQIRTNVDADVSELDNRIIRMVTEETDTPLAGIPHEHINFISRKVLASKRAQLARLRKAGIDTKGIDPEPSMTTGELLDVRKDLLRAVRSERAMAPPNENRLRLLGELIDSVEGSIQGALPGDRAIIAARAASNRFNTLFTKGPVGRMRARRRTGELRTPPGETTRKLLSDYDEPTGLQQLDLISRKITKDPAIIRQAEEAVKAEFQRAAAEEGIVSPEAAKAWLSKRKGTIRTAARLYTELKSTLDVMMETATRRTELEKSALSRALLGEGQDPQVAISRIYSNANPAKLADNMLKRMRNDPEAAEGLKNALLDELVRRTSFSGSGMRQYLSQPKYQRLFRLVLDDDSFRRLDEIISLSERIERGDRKGIEKLLSRGVSALGGVMGAALGRHVAVWTGGGTVQIPGIFAKIGRDIAEGAMARKSPSELVALAIRDEAWERILRTRLPQGPTWWQDGRLMLKNARRLIYTLDASETELRRRLEKEGQ